MQAAKVAIALGFGAAMVGGVVVLAKALMPAKAQQPKAITPAPIDPTLNPNVDYSKPAISVGIATGYNDVNVHQEKVNLDHIGTDYTWQYSGYVQ